MRSLQRPSSRPTPARQRSSMPLWKRPASCQVNPRRLCWISSVAQEPSASPWPPSQSSPFPLSFPSSSPPFRASGISPLLLSTPDLPFPPRVKHVYGFELVPSAVADAELNKRRNGISNATFFQGDLNKLTDAFGEHLPPPDVIIVGEYIRTVLGCTFPPSSPVFWCRPQQAWPPPEAGQLPQAEQCQEICVRLLQPLHMCQRCCPAQ